MRRTLSTVLVASAILLVPAWVHAQDLVPAPAGGDPNAAPPPPPPMPPDGTVGSAKPPPPPGSTGATLAAASDADTGVGLHFVYVQPEVGFGWATLGKTITNSDYRSGAGLAFGVGAGLEFITFQARGRLRALSTPNYTLWTLGGELAYQPGSGRFWPRVGLAIGYAWGSNWKTETCLAECNLVGISGLDIGLRGGVQYYVAPTIEIGFDVGLDALMLKRPAIMGSTSFNTDVSSTGFLATGMAHVGFHYP